MGESGMSSIRSRDGEEGGITKGCGDDIVLANQLISRVEGEQLIQFRMGCGVHLEFGIDDFEVTIETSLVVVDGSALWSGEPLTADAAGALLPLNHREVTSAKIATDGALSLGFGQATLSVPPHPMAEAWQLRGPDGLLIVCLPGGDRVAVWEPETP